MSRISISWPSSCPRIIMGYHGWHGHQVSSVATTMCVCAPPPCKSVSENRKPRMYGSSGIFTSKLVKLRKCSPFCLPCSEIDNADNTAQSWLLWSNKGAFCFSSTAHGMPVGNAEARNPINFGSAMGGWEKTYPELEWQTHFGKKCYSMRREVLPDA